ncbi:MAG TPA: ABC transporter permease [Caulobacteraceae bacterium]|nr:ABC transporter permease [Caulobacteraceae bacterium]
MLLAILIAIWEIACRMLKVPTYFLPAPSDVAKAAAADPGSLLISAWRTLEMALMALVTVSILGTGLALAVAGSETLERAARPLAVTIQVTPVIAIAPLALIWAGLDHPGRAIIGLAAVVAFFPIFSGALTGLKSADPDLERLFDLYEASPAQRLLRLRLPSAVPFILEGHKVAAGQAVIGAVVAEFVAQSGAAQGLAWRILEAGQRLQTARMFAALLALAVMGAAVYGAMTMVERMALRWWRGR